MPLAGSQHARSCKILIGVNFVDKDLPELLCDSVDVSAAVTNPGDSVAVVLSCCLIQASATRPAGCALAAYCAALCQHLVCEADLAAEAECPTKQDVIVSMLTCTWLCNARPSSACGTSELCNVSTSRPHHKRLASTPPWQYSLTVTTVCSYQLYCGWGRIFGFNNSVTWTWPVCSADKLSSHQQHAGVLQQLPNTCSIHVWEWV